MFPRPAWIQTLAVIVLVLPLAGCQLFQRGDDRSGPYVLARNDGNDTYLFTATIAEGGKDGKANRSRSETIRLDPGMEWKYEVTAKRMVRIRCDIASFDSYDASAVSDDTTVAGKQPVVVGNIGSTDISCTATIVAEEDTDATRPLWARTFVLPPQRRGKLGYENTVPYSVELFFYE